MQAFDVHNLFQRWRHSAAQSSARLLEEEVGVDWEVDWRQRRVTARHLRHHADAH